MQYCSLSSSSVYGNSYLIRSPGGHLVLVDAGVPLRRLEGFLAGMDICPQSILAILVTHLHRDHTAALRLKRPLARKYGIPVYASDDFWVGWERDSGPTGDLSGLRMPLNPGDKLWVEDLSIEAFPRPHDSPGSQGYLVCSAYQSLAVATDLGHVPEELASSLQGVTHLLVESNYDQEMELASPRPEFLKRRVMGSLGHLSNDQAAGFLARSATPDTRSVLLTHLSLECNTVPRAAAAARGSLHLGVDLQVAPPGNPGPWSGCS